MNLLYVAPLPIDINNLGGVPKKIFAQLEALSDYFNCKLIYYNNGKVKVYDWITKEEKDLCDGRNRLDVIKTTIKVCQNENFEGVYIRYPKSENVLLELCKTLSKNNTRYVIEIPTFPYDKEGNESIKGRLINLLDRIYRKKLKKYVARIVTYSSDETIFGIPTINTINGIDFNKISADFSEVDCRKQINAIAVSAMYRVHGYDRFIEGLHWYYSKGGTRDIVLRLVGTGDKCNEYKNLVSKYKLEDHVVFLGTLLGESLENAYQGCAVGVNSLAIHRQGLKNESTLKTKEYAAKGLPIVSSSYVDALSAEGNKRFIYFAPATDSPVDIEAFVEFVDGLYNTMTVQEIRNRIRDDGRKTCDVHITMKPIIDYLIDKGE